MPPVHNLWWYCSFKCTTWMVLTALTVTLDNTASRRTWHCDCHCKCHCLWLSLSDKVRFCNEPHKVYSIIIWQNSTNSKIMFTKLSMNLLILIAASATILDYVFCSTHLIWHSMPHSMIGFYSDRGIAITGTHWSRIHYGLNEMLHLTPPWNLRMIN